MATGIIYGMLAFFVVAGVLLGLKRGLIKAVIRIITVLITCVAVVFLVQPITSAILTTDLSSSGLVIGEVPVTTINDTIINYLSQLLGLGQLLQSSPTLVAVINAVPAVILNIVLFILMFFVFKGIFYFVAIIFNKIIIKKDSNKPVRRVWGAVVGGVQGFICFLFVLLPIAGTMNLVTDTLNIVNEGNNQTQAVSFVSLTSEVSETTEEDSAEITKIKSSAIKTVEEYNDIFLIKAINKVGYEWLSNSVFDRITTIEINDKQQTTLRNEVTVVARVINGYEKLKNVDVAKFSEQNEKDANELIDNLFSSPIVGGVSTELIDGIANTWVAVNPGTFVGVEKPVKDEKLVKCFDTLLLSLRNDTAEDLAEDLKVVVKTLRVSASHGLTEKIGSGDTDTIVSVIGKEGCMEELVGTISSGKATKMILPAVVELGLNYGYEAVGMENVEVNITQSASNINWETEKVVLGDLFEGLSKTYESTKGEGELINKLDFLNFAKVLNSIRSSELLKDCGQTITINLLKSELVVGIDVSNLILDVENSTTYDDLDFVVMLQTLKSSANIASDLDKISKGEKESLNSEDIGTLLDGLTSGGATQDALKNLASSENLKEVGVEESTANAVNGLVDSITDYEGSVATPKSEAEIQSATSAVENLLGASQNAFDTNKGYVFSDNEEEAKASMTELIDSMLSSPFIYEATINKGEELGFKTVDRTNTPHTETSKLSTEEQGWLKQVLENYSCTQTQKEEILNMFAVS